MQDASVRVLSAICDEIALVLTSDGADLGATLGSIGPLLEWVLLEEERGVGATEPVALRPAANRASLVPHLTTDGLADYLRARFDDPGAVVGEIKQIAGGFSKRTTYAACRYQGRASKIVIRQIANSQKPNLLAEEYGVIEHAWNNGLQCPEPLWLEQRATDLGEPFFVSRAVEGSNPGDVFGAGAGSISAVVGQQLAEFTAKLHELDVTGLTAWPKPALHTRQHAQCLVEETYANLSRAVGRPDKSARKVFDWLRAHLPNLKGQPRFVHGDIGFHNLLVRDDEITAVLDWERAHAGHPAEDLAYIKPTLERVMSWDEFLACYVAAGGQAPDADTLRFFTVWQDAWRYVSTMVLLAGYESSPRLSSVFAGRIFGPRFLSSACAATIQSG